MVRRVRGSGDQHDTVRESASHGLQGIGRTSTARCACSLVSSEPALARGHASCLPTRCCPTRHLSRTRAATSTANPRKQFSGADASFFPGTAEEYRTGYRAQATYALGRAVEASRRLLEASRRDRRDAIVIITGDHGPRLGFDARKPTAESGLATLPVLLAIRWPSRARRGLPYEYIVNVYRAVFSKAFGMELPMLADKGYVSSFSTAVSGDRREGPRRRSVQFAGLAVHTIFSPRLDNPTWIADSRRPQREATVFACVSEFEKRGIE